MQTVFGLMVDRSEGAVWGFILYKHEPVGRVFIQYRTKSGRSYEIEIFSTKCWKSLKRLLKAAPYVHQNITWCNRSCYVPNIDIKFKLTNGACIGQPSAKKVTHEKESSSKRTFLDPSLKREPSQAPLIMPSIWEKLSLVPSVSATIGHLLYWVSCLILRERNSLLRM